MSIPLFGSLPSSDKGFYVGIVFVSGCDTLGTVGVGPVDSSSAIGGKGDICDVVDSRAVHFSSSL